MRLTTVVRKEAWKMKEDGTNQFEGERSDTDEVIPLSPDTAESEPVLTFPCEMPMRIIGENDPEMIADVLKAFAANGVEVNEADLKTVPSREKKYISVNYTFTAQSREQVDAIYIALTKNPRIKWVI